MPRSAERSGGAGSRGQGPTGQGAVVRGNSGGHVGVGRVNGDGVGGAVDFGVVEHHLRQAEVGGQRGGYGTADEAAGVADEEGHFVGGHVFGGADQVAFVLAGG